MIFRVHQGSKELSDFFQSVFDEQFELTFQKKRPNDAHERINFVLEDADNIIAAASCERIYETLKINDLAVISSQQKRGLGSQLLNGIKSFSLQNEIKTIILTTRSYQAKDFYLRHGFVLYGTLENVPFEGVDTYYLSYKVNGN
ncbi:GNAT family N-acetyltransferase [Streptococcus henryi]|uniref:GNAT family N-acetyltransferase n=1 Tax=Streptococcus henryi TaxID=439219 RepID=UPI000361371F|nr:GNAT family N-acetyltransferase [Streptococcus henryi]